MMKEVMKLTKKMRLKINFFLNIDKKIQTKSNLVIKTITLIGSVAIVKINIESGGPNANNKQPKNSINAILFYV